MKLFAHQIKALSWANSLHHFACFMEMRTGKSLVCLHQCKRWGGKVLLVAPLSTWMDWQTLLQRNQVSYVCLYGSTKWKQELMEVRAHKAEWVLINPEGLTRWGKDFFKSYDIFSTCVLDESPFIKNPKAKITKLLQKHRNKFEHRMIMTGTPIAEVTEDIVSQMIWCHGSFMDVDNFYLWRCRYMAPRTFGWALKKGVKPVLRDAIRDNAFVLSAKDAGLFTSQTEKTYLVEMPTDIRASYKKVFKEWLLTEEVTTKFATTRSLWLAALSCGIYPSTSDVPSNPFKVKAVRELLFGELRGQQVVIFSRWLKEVAAVGKSLNCPIIDGSTPYEERERYIKEFRLGITPYIVMQSKAACRGLDLSCTNTAIMLSNYWQHEIRAQILARMKHPTKRIPTLFIDVITKDSIEEQVYEVLQDKHDNARYFLQRLKAKVKQHGYNR